MSNDGHNHSLRSDLGCLLGFALLALIAVVLLAALAGCKPSIRPDRNQPTPTSSPMHGPGPDGR